MAISKDDARLTKLALGEMDEAEKKAFLEELGEAPEATLELSEIEETARLLSQELGGSIPHTLTDGHRAAVEEALKKRGSEEGAEPQKAKVIPLRKPRLARVLAYLSAAAVVGGAFFAATLTVRSKQDATAPEMKPQASAMGGEQGVAPTAAATAGAVAEDGQFPHRGAFRYRGGKGDGLAAEEKLKGDEKSAGPRWCSPGDPLCRPAGPGKPHVSSFDGGGIDAPRQPQLLQPKFVAPPPPPTLENPFVDTRKDTKSTFSIDVDTASYAWLRRSIEEGHLPDPQDVRIEEMLNYFSYDYPAPTTEAFSVNTEVAEAPWNRRHRLVRIGLRGKSVTQTSRPASNLVFLVDVSGSMESNDRLPLLVQGLGMLVKQLDERDHVSIVTYAGTSGVALPSTSGSDKATIQAALDGLKAGGSTNGGSGIDLAYSEAAKHFVKGGTNRVILATDGDFNVGVTGGTDLATLAAKKAEGGVFLSVLGFGMGNYRDHTLEEIADKGNGNYAYIDGLDEAKKVLVDQAAGTLFTIAKDVKIQVTFDAAEVASFKLIGYEDRGLAHQDFADDRKDAGDIGAGHTVTALYEVVTRGAVKKGMHIADVALRFKEPDGQKSKLVEGKIVDGAAHLDDASSDFRFAASVAGFGLLLKKSGDRGDFGLNDVLRIAGASLGTDADGYRKGFTAVVGKAALIK